MIAPIPCSRTPNRRLRPASVAVRSPPPATTVAGVSDVRLQWRTHFRVDSLSFGVLLAVNMQTSFMHPPFGFALFYLRSVAPKEDYHDRVTGKMIAKVTTGQIYWGSVPFICIQVLMVAAVMVFPGMVTHYKSDAVVVDPSTINFGTDNVYGSDSYGGGAGGAVDPGAAFK